MTITGEIRVPLRVDSWERPAILNLKGAALPPSPKGPGFRAVNWMKSQEEKDLKAGEPLDPMPELWRELLEDDIDWIAQVGGINEELFGAADDAWEDSIEKLFFEEREDIPAYPYNAFRKLYEQSLKNCTIRLIPQEPKDKEICDQLGATATYAIREDIPDVDTEK